MSKRTRNWMMVLLLGGGACIVFLVFVLNCSGTPLLSLLSFFGLSCISDQGTVDELAFALFGLWAVVLGVPVLASLKSSKQS